MTYQTSSAVRPTNAFVAASWATLLIGLVSFAVGLWNSGLAKSEVGFYAATMILGVFAGISLQKSVRDKAEGLPVTVIYLGVAWAVVALSMIMMVAGLWNSGMTLSERGFYGLAFLMTLFAAVAVQKNVRDALSATNGDGQPVGQRTY